jgi:endonuclease/exonuclease/phosphatase family metal-dependent hydrolase
VSHARADEAYAFQAAALRSFVARAIPRAAPAFLGGDFNTDDAARWKLLGTDALPGSRNALAAALSARTIAPGAAGDIDAIRKRDKDWLWFRGSGALPLAVTRYSVPFGKAPDGSSLSDHLGYAVDFRIGAQRAS